MCKPMGYCHLCGEFRKLSEEHIPPESAFNDQQVLFETIQNALGMTGRIKYTRFRGAIKKTSLCEKCNMDTGSWYGTAFAPWARQGFEWLDKLSDNAFLALPFYIRPLNVIKQIITMLLAVTSEDRLSYYEEARRFVLNRQLKYLPPDFRVFVYFNRGSKPRFVDIEGVVARTDIGAIDYVNAEVALPPFGYVITSTSRKGQKSLAEFQGLYDISWFSHFDYNMWTSVYLKLPIRETHAPFPLDYRSETEVTEHRRKIAMGSE